MRGSGTLNKKQRLPHNKTFLSMATAMIPTCPTASHSNTHTQWAAFTLPPIYPLQGQGSVSGEMHPRNFNKHTNRLLSINQSSPSYKHINHPKIRK